MDQEVLLDFPLPIDVAGPRTCPAGMVSYLQLPAAAKRELQRIAEEQGASFMAAALICDLPLDLAAFVVDALSQYVDRPFSTSDLPSTRQFDWFTASDFALTFRFASVAELQRIVENLRMPAIMHKDGHYATALDALAVTLARYATPTRVKLLGRHLRINWSSAKISTIVGLVLDFLLATWGPLISLDDRYVAPVNVGAFVQAIKDYPSPVSHIFGFIDGTKVRICRPTREQDLFYSGNECYHLVRFQGLMLPNGIMAGMFGPEVGNSKGRGVFSALLSPYSITGSSNDKLMYGNSNWDTILTEILGESDYQMYGDSGYGSSTWVMRPLTSHDMTTFGADAVASVPEINRTMSILRVCVWSGGLEKLRGCLIISNTGRV